MDSANANFTKRVEEVVRDYPVEVKTALKGPHYPLLEQLFGGLEDPRPELCSFVKMYRKVFKAEEDGSSLSVVASEVVPDQISSPSSSASGVTKFCLEMYRMRLYKCFNVESITCQNFVREDDLCAAHEEGTRRVLSWLEEREESNTIKELIKSTLEKECGWIRAINTERFKKYVHHSFEEELWNGTLLLQNSFRLKNPTGDGVDNGPKGEMQAMNEKIDNEIKSRVQSFRQGIPEVTDEVIINLVNNTAEVLLSKLGELGRQVKTKNKEFVATFATSYLKQVVSEYAEEMGSFLGPKSSIHAVAVKEAHQMFKGEAFQKWEGKIFALDRAFSTAPQLVKLNEMMEQSFSQLLIQKRGVILQQYFAERKERHTKEAMQLMQAIGGDDESFCAKLSDSLVECERSLIMDKLTTVQTGHTGIGEDGNMAPPGTRQNPNNVPIPTSISIASTSTNNFENTTTCSSSNGTGGSGPGEENIPQESSHNSHSVPEINPTNSDNLDPGNELRIIHTYTVTVGPTQASTTIAPLARDHQLQAQQSPSSSLLAGHASKWDLEQIPYHEHLLPKATSQPGKRKSDVSIVRESLGTFGITITSCGGLRAAITIDNIPYLLVESGGESVEKASIFPLLMGLTSDSREFVFGNDVTRLNGKLRWIFAVGQRLDSEHNRLGNSSLTAELDGKVVTFPLELLLGKIIHHVKTRMEQVLKQKFGRKSVCPKKLFLSVPPHFKGFQVQQLADATVTIGLEPTCVATLAEPTLLAFDFFRKELSESQSSSGNILIICQYSSYIVLNLFYFARRKSTMTISPLKAKATSLDFSKVQIHEQEIFTRVWLYLKDIEGMCISHPYICLKTGKESPYSKIIRNAISATSIVSTRVFQFDELASVRGVTSVGNYGYWRKSGKRVDLSSDWFVIFKGDPSDVIIQQVDECMAMFSQFDEPKTNSESADGIDEPRKKIRKK